MISEARYKSDKFEYATGITLANNLFKSYATKQFDAEQMMEKAVKTTGLTDFGDLFFEEPLTRLIEDINKNTNFHPVGAFLYRNKILLNLINRLWAQYWLKNEVDATQPMPPTLLITGLQRTGTTFLQRMLGSLPEFRGIISWEIVNPVPKSKEKKYFGKYQALVGHKMLNYISPEFKSIHSVKPNSLEEEAALMDHTFMSTIAEASLNVPEYSLWMESQNHLPAYQDLKKWLHLLLWRKPTNSHLLLKSPHHMDHLSEFTTTFPNAKIIHTHRHPAKTLASFCSMVHFGKKIFSPESNPHDVGQHWLRKNKILVDACLDYRKDHDHLFMDVAYKNLVGEPIDTAKEIYKFLDLEWTDEHTNLAMDYCTKHRKNKYGKHVYRLSDFNLNEDLVQETFEDYFKEFDNFLI